jgi:hypothetical protein
MIYHKRRDLLKIASLIKGLVDLLDNTFAGKLFKIALILQNP